MSMKYLKIVIPIIIVAAIFHFATKHHLESSTPSFISNKVGELMNDKFLMDSLGGGGRFEFSYNENDYKFEDTLRYSIKIYGKKRTLVYNGLQRKISGTKWGLVSESLNFE